MQIQTQFCLSGDQHLLIYNIENVEKPSNIQDYGETTHSTNSKEQLIPFEYNTLNKKLSTKCLS